MRLLDAILPPVEARGQEWFTYNGIQYPVPDPWLPGSAPDQIDHQFKAYVDKVHRRQGVVAAAVTSRALILSSLEFVWERNRYSDRPGELYVDPRLRVFDRPNQDTTLNNWLWSIEDDVSYSGTAYGYRDGNTIRRLAPDHCAWLLGSDSDPTWEGEEMRLPHDAEVVALIYHPNKNDTSTGRVFFPGEFYAHKPEPDPVYWWRGESWVTSVMREILIDGQATDHFEKFFEHAATPNLVFLMDPDKTPDQVKAYADVVNRNHAGAMNSFKNMFLGGGTDVKVVGSTLESLQMKDLQGGLETRIASRAHIPGVILQIRESYAGSSLNTGNYGSARRLWSDKWFTPTAKGLCATLETIVRPPDGARLSYDPARILFLQEDQKDAAEIMATNAQAVFQFVSAGYTPDSARDAVATNDMSKLVHSGLTSVQLQPPGTGNDDE